jgi:ABC-type amino acid transport substrate-binding protein
MKRRIKMNGKKGFTLALCAAFMFVSLSIAAPSYGESVLNKIEKTGKVTMGFREGSIPFGFMNEKGEWVGFGLDLGYEIGRKTANESQDPDALSHKWHG